VRHSYPSDGDINALSRLARVASPHMASGVIVYGVIVPCFSADGLREVEAKVPYLRHLGVTMVWLSPIFAHPRAATDMP
jgi:glycosidase